MQWKKAIAAMVCTIMSMSLLQGCDISNSKIPAATVNTEYQPVTVDGSTVNMDAGTVYRGLGVVTGNNSSRLLMDYKTQNPDAYWEIMKLLFKPGYGAGLTHVKIEFGTDVNSSSGTEPSIMRAEDEIADVTRGAGFMFAADALSINPNITVDLLRWGEPKWVTDAFADGQKAGFAARYQWYKAAIDGAYDTYGMKFTHISADANEAASVDEAWIIYFAERLENETDERYDYGAIKIVASDEVGTWNIATAMMNNEALRNAVDILGEHYNTWASSQAKILNEQYGKELWYTEGIASTNIAKLSVNSNGSGLNGTNGALDVCNRIINGYYNGRMTMYEYQPAVAAYYSGAKYFPKSLINAQNPWSGYYEADCGIWTSAHFTHFMKNGWRYIDSACYGDGKENHSISETTNNYMTVTDTETGDYSIVICNDSDTPRNYTFTLTNMEKAKAPITLWETGGPDEGQAYNANYFKNQGTFRPVKTDSGDYAYSIEVKPYSIVTVTTLDHAADTSVTDCQYEDVPLTVPYSDDFEYADEFLSARGYAPLYTTDYGGAFEVAEIDGNKVLKQQIDAANKPTDWRFRSTPWPITSLGDDRWSNYSAEIDVWFASAAQDNYAALGVRYLCAELDGNAQNGYSLKLFPNGQWGLLKNTATVLSGTVEQFDNSRWHTLKLTAAGRTITAFVDGTQVAAFTDEKSFNHSGRVSLASGLYCNLYDNLKVTPIDGMESTITRVDDHDASVTYTGEWYRTVPDGYVHFNRTISRAEIAEGDTAEKSFSFAFTGSHFALIGETKSAVLEIYVDGAILETAENNAALARQCSYMTDVPQGTHTAEIKVISGTFTLDAIEYQ